MQRPLPALVCAVLFTGALPCAADNERDGLVLGIVGKWLDPTQKDGHIHFGSVLSGQSSVTCETSGSLTVWFHAAGKPVSIPCETAGTAILISKVREENAERGLVGSLSDAGSKLWQLVTPLIHQEPRSYIAAVSRGFGNAELEESVVALRARQIDLSPAFTGVPPGKYKVVFLPVAEEVADSPPVEVRWEPGQAAMAGVAPADTPAVKKIAIAAPDGTLSGAAWILLLPPSRYPAANARFREARSTVVQWPGGTHSQASRSVLRACLQALSQDAAR